MAKKIKGQEWYTIVAPKMFDEVELGRTLAADPQKIIGRRISISLMELIKDFRKYYIKFTFKVKSVEGDRATTVFDGSECMRDYVSRLVTRWSRRIDTVQNLATKDGVNIRVKSIAIIPHRVKSSIKAAVRDEIRAIIKSKVEEATLEELIKEIISDSIKKSVLRSSQRIYPIRSFEIRKTEIPSS